jgi:drug/metabolite transporter (DMT)-like permease
MLVVHPGVPLGDGADPAGVAIALSSAVFSSLAYVTVRQLAKTENPLVIVFYFPLVATPLAIPWAVADWVTPSATEWLVLAGMGIATQVGQVFVTKGLMLERASRATSVGYLQVIFAMIWQTVLWNDTPTLLSLAGAALIVVGTLTVARSERLTTAAGEAAAPAPRSAT